MTEPQIEALLSACVDAESYDQDALPGDPRIAQARVRERALHAILQARREQLS